MSLSDCYEIMKLRLRAYASQREYLYVIVMFLPLLVVVTAVSNSTAYGSSYVYLNLLLPLTNWILLVHCCMLASRVWNDFSPNGSAYLLVISGARELDIVVATFMSISVIAGINALMSLLMVDLWSTSLASRFEGAALTPTPALAMILDPILFGGLTAMLAVVVRPSVALGASLAGYVLAATIDDILLVVEKGGTQSIYATFAKMLPATTYSSEIISNALKGYGDAVDSSSILWLLLHYLSMVIAIAVITSLCLRRRIRRIGQRLAHE